MCCTERSVLQTFFQQNSINQRTAELANKQFKVLQWNPYILQLISPLPASNCSSVSILCCWHRWGRFTYINRKELGIWENEPGSEMGDLKQAGRRPKHLRRARTMMVKSQLSVLDEAGSESGLGSIQGVQSINWDMMTQNCNLSHLMLHKRWGDMDCIGPWVQKYIMLVLDTEITMCTCWLCKGLGKPKIR